MKTEKEIREEIKKLQDIQAQRPPLDFGGALCGTQIALLKWVLGDTKEEAAAEVKPK